MGREDHLVNAEEAVTLSHNEAQRYSDNNNSLSAGLSGEGVANVKVPPLLRSSSSATTIDGGLVHAHDSPLPQCVASPQISQGLVLATQSQSHNVIEKSLMPSQQNNVIECTEELDLHHTDCVVQDTFADGCNYYQKHTIPSTGFYQVTEHSAR